MFLICCAKCPKTKFELWQYYRHAGKVNEANEYLSAYNAFSVAINLFNYEDFYKRMAEIYEEKED